MDQAVTIHTTSALTAADLNTTINHEPRIMDLRLAEALGFDRIRDIRKLIKRHEATLKGFAEVCATWRKPSAAGGRPGTTYWLSKKQALFITAKSDTERAALVTVQMVEVFDAVTSGAAPQTAVKAHSRAASKRPPLTPLQKGRGVMMLDGLVYFDRSVLPCPGDEVLVVDEEGQPRVVQAADRPSYSFRPGWVWVRTTHPLAHRGEAWCSMPLIGVVTTPAGTPKRIVAH